MDELVNVMEEILIELKEMNSKLDDIQGSGIYKSMPLPEGYVEDAFKEEYENALILKKMLDEYRTI